jgi:hypothetical protein
MHFNKQEKKKSDTMKNIYYFLRDIPIEHQDDFGKIIYPIILKYIPDFKINEPKPFSNINEIVGWCTLETHFIKINLLNDIKSKLNNYIDLMEELAKNNKTKNFLEVGILEQLEYDDWFSKPHFNNIKILMKNETRNVYSAMLEHRKKI